MEIELSIKWQKKKEKKMGEREWREGKSKEEKSWEKKIEKAHPYREIYSIFFLRDGIELNVKEKERD